MFYNGNVYFYSKKDNFTQGNSITFSIQTFSKTLLVYLSSTPTQFDIDRGLRSQIARQSDTQSREPIDEPLRASVWTGLNRFCLV